MVMVNPASMARVGAQKPEATPKHTKNNFKNAPKAAILTTVAIKLVTMVGEPVYTSGLQKWKGAAPTLKHMAHNIMIVPTKNITGILSCVEAIMRIVLIS